MFRYKLHFEDGTDAGEAVYVQMIRPGDTIYVGGARPCRVLDLVEVDEEDGSPYVGLLRLARV